MGLSPKQQEEANKAVVGYLQSLGHEDAAQAVAQATGVDVIAMDEKFASLLERKWTSVVRLQKKVLQLEEELKQAQTEIKAPRSRASIGDSTQWIPRPPAK